jgi:membrane-associated phospholipid phosphatase
MPSLHAAFPLLSALYLRKSIGRRGWLMLGYGGIMWFAAVYLTEHWIIDVVAGLACTVIAYAAVESVATYLAGRRPRRVWRQGRYPWRRRSRVCDLNPVRSRASSAGPTGTAPRGR